MNWIKTKSRKESLIDLQCLARKCSDLGGPLTKTLYDFVEKGDYISLLEYEVDYSLPTTVDDFIYARQLLGFYQKLEFLDIGVDKEEAGWKRFQESEQICKETNVRHRFGRAPFEARVECVLHAAQQKISKVLGAVPKLNDLKFQFGPGATTSVPSSRACPRVKLDANVTCSLNMIPYAGVFLAEAPMWASIHNTFSDKEKWIVDVQPMHGKLVFVQKNAKTHRSIVVEPTLNGFIQKGIGTYMKDRLKRYAHVDLTDQSRNQKLAYEGSVEGVLATVDLSMASDTVATNLVASLLPLDWFELLSSCRTSTVTYDRHEGPIELQKFSSMGNAYNFELESLIFWALTVSCCEHLNINTCDVSVYGDDIIVPVYAMGLLEEVFDVCGFKINRSKSFSSGPFRESCGADYHSGISIRPYYQKTQVSDQTLYTTHNWFFRNGEHELAKCAESLITFEKIYGPNGYGDGHLIGSYKLRTPRHTRRRQWEGGFFTTHTFKHRSFKKRLPGDVVLPSYSVYVRSGEDSPTEPDTIRGVSGYQKIDIYTLTTSVF